MKYPTLILGAGASYDCFSENEKSQIIGFQNFPLANELCYAHYFGYLKEEIKMERLKNIMHPVIFEEIKKIFNGGEHFIKRIASSLNRTKSLEESVSDIWKKAVANNDKERQKQLVGFTYYLQFLFYFLSKQFGKETTNNYYALATYISDFLNPTRDAEAELLVINFNYDLLMDIAFDKMEDEKRLKYSKVHGSCDKCWVVRGGGYPYKMYDYNSGDGLIENYAEHFGEFFKRGPEEYDLLEIGKKKAEGDKFIMRPAILLPFYSKYDLGFPCFERDLQKIKSHLSNTDGILIIGWSAKDGELIKLMQDNIKKEIPLMVVAGNISEAKEIRSRLSKVPFYGNNTFNFVGFTNFMGLSPNKCEDFFSQL